MASKKELREAAIAAEMSKRASGDNGKSTTATAVCELEDSIEEIVDTTETPDEISEEEIGASLEAIVNEQQAETPKTKENTTKSPEFQTSPPSSTPTTDQNERLKKLEEIMTKQALKINELEIQVKSMADFREKVAIAVRQTLELEVSRVVNDKITATWSKKFIEILTEVKAIKEHYNSIAELSLYIEALRRLDSVDEKVNNAHQFADRAEKAANVVVQKIDSLKRPDVQKTQTKPTADDILG